MGAFQTSFSSWMCTMTFSAPSYKAQRPCVKLWTSFSWLLVSRCLNLSPRVFSPSGEQRVGQRAAGSEHQGSDRRSGWAPRLAHPGSGGGAAETRRGVGRSGGGEAELNGTRWVCGVHPGAAERNRPALLRAGRSTNSQQVDLLFTLLLPNKTKQTLIPCCCCCCVFNWEKL